MKQKQKIGFIGQGYIGKNYADNFEKREYKVVRYALEELYINNKKAIKDCDIVFIAVPTPTTPEGFDFSIVEDAIDLVGCNKIAVIKSTILPGTTITIQEKYPDRIILYSPEFLSEVTAKYDVENPFSNIVGIPIDCDIHKSAAEIVHNILPKAPHTLTCVSTEAEFIKYSHNMSGYVQIILFNILHDTAKKLNISWEKIQDALEADIYIPNRYANPVHKNGRGAGGHCFIKDFAAFKKFYEKVMPQDSLGRDVLHVIEQKNINLLRTSGKDIDLLDGVYGPLK